MMMITRDIHGATVRGILTARMPVVVVDGGAVGAVVMVRAQEPVTQVDGLVTMVPTTSRHVTDTEDSFL